MKIDGFYRRWCKATRLTLVIRMKTEKELLCNEVSNMIFITQMQTKENSNSWVTASQNLSVTRMKTYEFRGYKKITARAHHHFASVQWKPISIFCVRWSYYSLQAQRTSDELSIDLYCAKMQFLNRSHHLFEEWTFYARLQVSSDRMEADEVSILH